MEEIIVDVTRDGIDIVVKKVTSNKIGFINPPVWYDVYSKGVIRHPKCDADSAMRALGWYLHNGKDATGKIV